MFEIRWLFTILYFTPPKLLTLDEINLSSNTNPSSKLVRFSFISSKTFKTSVTAMFQSYFFIILNLSHRTYCFIYMYIYLSLLNVVVRLNERIESKQMDWWNEIYLHINYTAALKKKLFKNKMSRCLKWNRRNCESRHML